MKHLKLFLLAALALVACTKQEATQQKEEDPADPTPKELSFLLKSEHINVVNAEYDYMASIIGNSALITLDYLDKVNATALKVQFVNLPSGITATGFQETYDYVTNGTQTFSFTDGTASAEYSIGVGFTNPDPQFVDVSVNGVAVADGKVQLASSADLTQTVLTYTVSPEDTKVLIKGTSTEVKSGDVVDFSDKISGVTFTLSCGDVTKDVNIKVTTSGISKVTRVWGHYVKPVTVTDDWFGTKVTNTLDALRFIAMDDEYIYISRSQKDADRGAYAVKITDPSTVISLDIENVKASGVHHTSSVAVADNEDKSVILLCNLVNAADQHLYVYSYASVTAKAEVALDYVLPSAARLGDKMMFEGTWQAGKIWFYDSTSGTKLYCFTVTAGTVDANPTIIDMTSAKGAYAGGIVYPCGDNYYIWGGNKASSLYSITGTTATDLYEFPGETYGNPLHGINIFTVNGERYMAFVNLRNSYQDGQFRILPIPGATILEGLQNPGNPYVFQLGDPTEVDITADKNGNGCGGGALRQIGDKLYYAAFVTGAGLSLFEIE